MIRFSKMADYGVLLLGHFVRNAGELSSAADLSEAFHMPRSVVANLLKAFREAGLLTSKRGLRGGYQLARPAHEITLLEVLKVVDGPVRLIDCAVVDLTDVCDYEDVCTSRHPMQAVNQRIVDMLDSMSLAEIITTNEPISSDP